jgi:hypothetical protein
MLTSPTSLTPISQHIANLNPMDIDVPTLDAFGALLHALSPLIDDLLRKPEFHRFMDLPIELRIQVYEHYCHNDTKSLTCENWTEDKAPYIRNYWICWRNTAPFLPNICFVNRAISAEAVPFILRTLEYTVLEEFDAKHLAKRMDAYRIIPIGENVLKLNHRHLSNHHHAMLYARCFNVHYLKLHFCCGLFSPSFSKFPIYWLEEDQDPVNFDVQAVLSMEKIHQVTVSGHVIGYENMEDIKMKLSTVTKLARSIKTGFAQASRNVRVQVILVGKRWGDRPRETWCETTVL